ALSVAEARTRYLALMKVEPENLTPMEECVGMLRTAKDYAGAREIVRIWLASRPSKIRDLRWAQAVILEAKTLTDEKKWNDAWKVIQPAMETGKEDALLDGAWILEERGDWDAALETARDDLRRYPESVYARGIIARILWRKEKYAEAADFLASSKHLDRSAWEDRI